MDDLKSAPLYRPNIFIFLFFWILTPQLELRKFRASPWGYRAVNVSSYDTHDFELRRFGPNLVGLNVLETCIYMLLMFTLGSWSSGPQNCDITSRMSICVELKLTFFYIHSKVAQLNINSKVAQNKTKYDSLAVRYLDLLYMITCSNVSSSLLITLSNTSILL